MLFKAIFRCKVESFFVESVYGFVVFVGYGKIEFAGDAILLEVVCQLVAKIIRVDAGSYVATVRVVQ